MSNGVKMKYGVCIIGGAGHVGLPLGVAFANAGVKTALFDVNEAALKKIQAGTFPFREKDGDRELRKVLKKGTLMATAAPEVISQSEFVVLVIGTPVDKYLNPDFNGLMEVMDRYFDYFKKGQVLILRSTVFPGTSDRIQSYFRDRNKAVSVAFCPERIVEGNAFEELARFPQIVSASDGKALVRVQHLFRKITKRKIVLARPMEAELAKLFCNAWRYVKFAVANQFFMIAEDHGLDYHRIYEAMLDDYPRMKDLPSPGFAAGPCLLKDTMQLAAFTNNNFFLGHSAMLVNEGLPNYLLQKFKRAADKRVMSDDVWQKPVASAASSGTLADVMDKVRTAHSLKEKTIGILGMAFKADSDDMRDSLSYKLRKIAAVECKRVLCHDVYIQDPSFVPLDALIKKSDMIILAAPHKEYKRIDPRMYPGKTFIDIWGFWK